MDHVAIMGGKGKFLDAILRYEKTIESRWYKRKIDPWNNISPGDNIYFKNSCKLITAKAKVDDVKFFELYKDHKIGLDILKKYGKQILIDRKYYNENCADKNYCILVFLKDIKEITPFDIDKTGFGNAAAWLTIKDINQIKA
ncbi:MAG TPA: ASCH domain-containing protein [Alphaproteobacteria bacterium]|nr:ASCH domain-containing protein [Alphaproteobacteria bacterium]